MTELEKLAVEKYLEQVRLLTTLASALLVSPAILVAILRFAGEVPAVAADLQQASVYLFLSSGFLVLVIITTYLIYSSVVGRLVSGEVDLYRPATRVFSLLQILFLIAGVVFLVLFVNRLL